jgi:hypothetical protein
VRCAEDAGGNQARRKGAQIGTLSRPLACQKFYIVVCDPEAKLLYGKARQLFPLSMGGDRFNEGRRPTKRHIHPNLIRPRKKLKQFLIGYPTPGSPTSARPFFHRTKHAAVFLDWEAKSMPSAIIWVLSLKVPLFCKRTV